MGKTNTKISAPEGTQHTHDHTNGHTHSHEHNHTHEHTHEHTHDNEKSGAKAFIPQAISFALLICGVIMAHYHVSWFCENKFTELIWYIIAFLPVGLPVIKEAAEGIMKKDFFNEFTLMSIASIGAFCIDEYPEAVGVMLFYSLGELLQDMAVDRSTRDISKLLDMRGDKARVIRNGETILVDPKTVEIGETIEIKPGERVPLDGTMESPEGLFDTSALTGESIPSSIEKDGEVLAGMISSNSTVRLKVTKAYGQSALSRILELVEDARKSKASTELFIRRFARIYTPVVIILAALIVIIPAIVALLSPTFDYSFSKWLYRALVFLVISCPCALVISVPLGYFAGIGAASRAGILFKGGSYLESIIRVNTVAFDKTGTLTTGKFRVVKVASALSDKNELLSLMAAAESNSTHPMAQTLAGYVESLKIEVPTPEKMTEKAGYGVEAVVSGKDVMAGNLKMLKAENIAYPEELENVTGSIIVCAIDGKYAGYVVLEDTLKPDAAAAIKDLENLGISDVVMLSGDKKTIVKEYAKRLGIREAYGELLPQDKAEYVRKISGQPGKEIAFVGDGLNDAPVLALSDVGIAMGGLGSDAAIESADVVIQTDKPSKVATAIKIGRTTHAIVIENIVGAIGIKILILALGAFGIASLWAAVFADVGVALLAILNSMRILWKRY